MCTLPNVLSSQKLYLFIPSILDHIPALIKKLRASRTSRSLCNCSCCLEEDEKEYYDICETDVHGSIVV